MADQGGSQHGIARTSRVRTDEQRQRDLDRIAKYRDLEGQMRALADAGDYARPDLLALTSRLLRLNPEYYTIWNARRRCLISGSFSRPSPGSSCLTACSSTSRTATTAASSTTSSSSSSAATPPAPASQTAGTTGTTTENPAAAEQNTSQPQPDPADAEARDLATIQSELSFTIPLLLESPKCYWIWSYRQWILEQAISRLAPSRARRVWEEELGLASKMLGKDRRNFHAWGYRRHLVARLESPDLAGSSLTEPEFAYTDKMIATDLSNFSAWHRRSRLIPRLLEERGADDEARRAFFDYELTQIGEALNVGPEDQSLWYYHQFLISSLTTPATHPAAAMTSSLSQQERVEYLSREIAEIKELLDDYGDVKLVYEALFEYTRALCEMEGREATVGERGDLERWLGRLRKLDPMRRGRWEDLRRECGLSAE
ncbi:hypothetical protein C8A05DRAFT_34213 [Staphylotrichum tortipilum]|uniref:Geranylgeranyl transferase type-2 subunit alpha n=1 Tax=Staphylotrichum tortipilum TaxID=2831512 RepID=A0AAN6MJJ9_9PEZI|nr:hypothetical protein C8A05DRAFT_34213 [Staphylotrichum longicolle]